MAHLAPHLHQHHHHHQSNAAIFSPSVARAAASTAKDWSFVDDWLHRKYAASSASGGGGGKTAAKRSSWTTVPQFERNPETLKALLALAAANEASRWEYAHAYRLAWASIIPFVVLAIVAVWLLKSMKHLMTEKVEATLERVQAEDAKKVGDDAA